MNKELALYELKQEYLEAIGHFLDTGEGEEFAKWLNTELQVKAVRVAEYFRNRELLVDQIKLAEQQMAARRKNEEREIAWLKRYLKENMEQAGISQIETPYFKLSVQKNPPRVVIADDDTAALPDELVEATVRMTRAEYDLIRDYLISDKRPPEKPMRAEIKEKLTRGETVEGAALVQDTRLKVS